MCLRPFARAPVDAGPAATECNVLQEAAIATFLKKWMNLILIAQREVKKDCGHERESSQRRCDKPRPVADHQQHARARRASRRRWPGYRSR
jgi:hypothetical protein